MADTVPTESRAVSPGEAVVQDSTDRWGIVRYAVRRGGIALIALWIGLNFAFVIYMHLGTTYFPDSKSRLGSPEVIRQVTSVFGPQRSALDNYVHYLLAFLKGDLGYSVDPSGWAGWAWGYLATSMAWMWLTTLVGLAGGLYIGSRSLTKRPRRGVVPAIASAGLASLPIVWIPVVVAMSASGFVFFPLAERVGSRAASWLLTSITCGVVMAGEYGLVVRKALRPSTPADTPKDKRERRRFRWRAVLDVLPIVIRSVPRTFGYLAGAMAAGSVTIGLRSVAGLLNSFEFRDRPWWHAGVFMTYMTIAIFTWFACDLTAFMVEKRASPRPTAKPAVSFASDGFTTRSKVSGMIGAAIFTLLVLVALMAPILSPHFEGRDSFGEGPLLAAPFSSNGGALGGRGDGGVFGTDDMGRPMSALLVWGLRDTLFRGLAITTGALAIGAALGLSAMRGPNRLSAGITSITNSLLMVPWIIVLLITFYALSGEFDLPWGELVLAVFLCSIPYRATVKCLWEEQPLSSERWRAIGVALAQSGGVVFGLAIATWVALEEIGIGPGSNVSLGYLIYNASRMAWFGWWTWVMPGVLLLLLAFAPRLAAATLGRRSSPR